MATLDINQLENALSVLALSTPLPQFASADLLNQPLDLIRTYLTDILSSLLGCDPIVAYASIQLSNDPLHGDFTVVLPKLLPGSKAGELAADLIKRFPTEHPLFGLPWLDGIQLRLCLKAETLPRLILPFIKDRKETYGVRPSSVTDTASQGASQKRLIVEFSSPKIASDFEAKHLRSTILGAFISTIYERFGWSVTKRNYLGDWGKDIALLGVGFEKFYPDEALDQASVERLLEVSHRIHEQFQPEVAQSKAARDEAKKSGVDENEATAEIESKGLFADRNEFFKRMVEGDEKAAAFHKYILDVNVSELTVFYKRLGITFDEYFGESEVSAESIQELEDLLREKGLLEESGGALIIDMKKCGVKTGPAVFRDRTGSHLYLTRYLASVLHRSRQSEFDKMVFVAADRSGLYTRMIQIFKTIGMNELADKLQHIPFNDTSHMAEQVGAGYQPETILDKCESAMLEALSTYSDKSEALGTPEDVAKPVAMTALLAQEVSTKRSSDHAFDIKNMASLKSGVGLHLQYWYSRLERFIEDNRNEAEVSEEEYGELTEEEHTSFLILLGQFPEIVHVAFRTLEPGGIVTYLNSVVEQVEDFLDEDEEESGEGSIEGAEGAKGEAGPSSVSVDVEEDEKKISPAEVALYEAARQVLENGIRLLGFPLVVKKELDRADTPIEE